MRARAGDICLLLIESYGLLRESYRIIYMYDHPRCEYCRLDRDGKLDKDNKF